MPKAADPTSMCEVEDVLRQVDVGPFLGYPSLLFGRLFASLADPRIMLQCIEAICGQLLVQLLQQLLLSFLIGCSLAPSRRLACWGGCVQVLNFHLYLLGSCLQLRCGWAAARLRLRLLGFALWLSRRLRRLPGSCHWLLCGYCRPL